MSEVVVKIENLRKKYRLGLIGGGTLQGDIQSWWAKVRGKEDPNSKIGSKAYNRNETFYALDGIDLEIHKGDAIGIIGGNGAGKSTMLKILSRVTAPTEGVVSVKGRISSMLEVGTGFHSELTGRENIYLNGAILGMSRTEVDSKIEEIIDFSEVRQFIDTPVKRYSSGMYVKLAFAVAAHLDSEILVMDEVLAVGDMAFQNKCIQKMIQLANSDRTILYVSHNMNTIKQLCNRTIVLEHGKKIFDGSVDEGVDLYLGLSKQEVQTDVSNAVRPTNIKGGARMTYIEAEQNTISEKEKLGIKINWKNDAPYDDIHIRLVIKHRTGDPIGIVDTKSMSFKEAKENHMKVFFDPKNLAAGMYVVNVSIIQKDLMGTPVMLDRLENIVSFALVNSPERENVSKILRRWQGSVIFNDLEVENID